MSLGISFF